MNKLFNWFVENWGSFFSFLGVVFTIYFGVFYVPAYLEKAAQEKELAIHNDILQTTKELVYSDSLSNINEVINLIKGKEIKYEIKYKYNVEEMLLQAQESFMEHKFLPLQKRKELTLEVDELKKSIPEEYLVESEKSESKFSSVWWQRLLSILLSLLGSVAALYSLWVKRNQEIAKSEEIKNQVIKEKTNPKPTSQLAQEFETRIIKIITNQLSETDYKFQPNPDSTIDFIYTKNDVRNYVFIKYLSSSKVGLGTIRNFLYELQGREGNAIIIYNTDLTSMVYNELKKFQEKSDKKIKMVLIPVKDINEFDKTFKV